MYNLKDSQTLINSSYNLSIVIIMKPLVKNTTVTSVDLYLMSEPTPVHIEKKEKHGALYTRIMAAFGSIKNKGDEIY